MPDNRKLHPVRILTLFISLLAMLAGTFAPDFSVLAATSTARQAGPHFMPFTPPGIHPLVANAAPAGAHLTYYNGPVVSNMKSILVGYGPGTYISGITPGAWIPAFVSQYLGSGVMDWLNEYNTNVAGGTNQVIGRGTFSTMVTITPASSNNGSTIQDSNIQNELNRQIAAGFLPAPDANTSYAFFFRLGQSICSGGSCSLVGGGFCAYHSTFTAANGVIATYQVIPDLTGMNGCGSSTDLNNTTSVLSHELIETITDPQVGIATVIGPPLGWYDLTNGEIGDICNAQQGTFVGGDGNTYTIQQQFSNIANNCIVTQAPVAANDFSISTSPVTLSVAQGASATSTISTAVVSGSAASVSLSVTGAPTGVTASLSPTSVSAGASSTLTVAVDTAAVPGPYTLAVSGTEGTTTHSATVSLTIPAPVVANDFSISAIPATLNVTQGASGTSTVSTAVTAGVADVVSLSVTGAPAGMTASLSPVSVSAGASSTLTVAVDTTAVPGPYTLTVSGTEGTTTHSATVSLTIPAPVVPNDFSISATPAALNVTQGASGTATISTAVTAGVADVVNLSVTGAPAGVTASLSPVSVSAGASSTLTVAVDTTAVPGPYTLTVTGTEGTFSHSATVSLTIPTPVVPNDFSINASPVTLNVTQGASGTATVSTAVTAGVADVVSLSVTGAPAGVTASLSPVSVSAGASSTLTVAVGATAAAGPYTLTVTGAEGTTTHTATVALTITLSRPPFPTSLVLDNFNRANGGVGGNWMISTNTDFYKIGSNRLDVQFGGPLVWKPTSFSASQEAFVTLSAIDNRSSSQGLMLKAQTSSIPNAGAILVVYDAQAKAVRVSTLRLNSQTWKAYASTPATFANGDQLGGRVLANGTVEIYKNGALLTTVTLNAADQAFFNSKGGKIGLWAVGAPNAFFDNFGGGNVTP